MSDLKLARELLSGQFRHLVGPDGMVKNDADIPAVDSIERAMHILDQVDKATLKGVKIEDIQVLPDGTLTRGRRSQPDLSRVDTTTGERYLPDNSMQSPAGKGRSYAQMFGLQRLDNCGFKSIHDIGQAMRFGDSQALGRLMITGNSAGVPADGGFLVPEQFVSDTLDMALESEIVRPRCRIEPMTSGTKNISSFDDASHASGELYGGVTMQFIPEGGDLEYQVAKTRRVTLHAHKGGWLFSATNELLSDAPDAAGGLQTRMAAAFSWNVDRICLATGTGAGQPRAILNDPSLIVVSKEVGQAASTLVYENFTKMFARMHPACLRRAVWVVSQNALPQLLRLTITVGTTGIHIPVLNESNGQYSILGRPVVFTEKNPALSSQGDVMFVDFSQYALGLLRNGLRIDMSQHVKFTTDETVWRCIMRFDGQGLWKSAFTPVNGDTLSWCVTLEAR